MPKAAKQKRKAVHPNSRKALQLSRREHHLMKLERRSEEQNIKLQPKLKKLRWFRENLDEDKKTYTPADMKELIISYLHRNDDEEADDVTIPKGRKVNVHMKQQYAEFIIEKEKQDFETCGIEVPDLLNEDSMDFFRMWKGDVRYLTSIEIVTLSSKKLDSMIVAFAKEQKAQEERLGDVGKGDGADDEHKNEVTDDKSEDDVADDKSEDDIADDERMDDGTKDEVADVENNPEISEKKSEELVEEEKKKDDTT